MVRGPLERAGPGSVPRESLRRYPTREHAEPGHEEVRASEIEIGRERASERERASVLA